MRADDSRVAELRGLLTLIENDRQAIRVLVQEAVQVIAGWSDTPPKVEVAGVALVMHHVYTAAEHMFQKIAEVIDETSYRSEAWHRELLRSMGIPIRGIRDNVIRDDTLRKLDELRGFRHVVRHAYEYQLNAERVKTLAAELPALEALFERDPSRFADELKRRIADLEAWENGSQDG